MEPLEALDLNSTAPGFNRIVLSGGLIERLDSIAALRGLDLDILQGAQSHWNVIYERFNVIVVINASKSH